MDILESLESGLAPDSPQIVGRVRITHQYRKAMYRFRYSLNSSTIRPTPLLRKIEIAAAVGYGGIELWHDDIDAYLAGGGTISDVRKSLADHGLEVPTTIYLGDWFDSTGIAHARALEECKRRMQQAVEVNAPHVIAGPPMGGADFELGAKNYRELLTIGEQMGVLPAMEFLGFVEELNTIEDALEIIEKSAHPRATIVLDPFHIQRGGGSVESIAKLSGSQIAVAHFMDTVDDPPREQQHDAHRALPGEGVFDLKRYLELLEEVGFRGFLSLELFREDLWAQDPHEVARIGLEKMREVVES